MMILGDRKEERRMRKYFLIGASMLLLAAGTACNKQSEMDVQPADGLVKLRFTAVVDDGATKTTYANDKTASWVAGDQISVYVTNGTDGQVVTFTADASLTFEGNVPAGYTTIVAGAYPADAAHTFDASGVKTLHLPASYTLAADADPASIIPLVGTFSAGRMTFRHPTGVLKFNIDQVPTTAVRFDFTTFGHKINGNFNLDPVLDDTLVDAEKTVSINFTPGTAPAARIFYVPLPAGELYAESVISLYDAEGNILYKKVAPATITVTKNVVKKIAGVETWSKNETWQATYIGDAYVASSSKVVSKVQISGTTGKYGVALYAKSTFDKNYGTAEKFLASNYIPNKKASGAEPYTKNVTINFTRLGHGAKTVVIYGVDDNYDFTGEYNLIEFEVPEFTQPADWHLTFNPTYNVSGKLYPAVHVQVPEGTSWATANLKKETFQSDYGGDAVAYLWTRLTSTATIRTSTDINLYFSSLDEGDYVYIVYGVHEREQEGGNRTLTYEYALLEYTYTKPSDEPTAAYNAWLGKWSVTDESKTDTWTISAKENNGSYNISGLIGRTTDAFVVVGLFNEDGSLTIKAQKSIGTTTYDASDGNTYDVTLNLYGRKESSGSAFSGTYSLLKATMDESNPNAAALAPAGQTYFYYTFYGSYVNASGSSKGVGYGTRSATATMTRVVEEGVMAPDDWATEAEDFTMVSNPVEVGEVILPEE